MKINEDENIVKYDEKGYDKYGNKNPKYTPDEIEDVVEVKESDLSKTMEEIIKGEKIYIVGMEVTEDFCIEGSGWKSVKYDDIKDIFKEKTSAEYRFFELRKNESEYTTIGYGRKNKAFIKEAIINKEYEPKDITQDVLKQVSSMKKAIVRHNIKKKKEIDITKLGIGIGMEEKEQTLPNGKQVKSLVWDKENLLKAVDLVKPLSGEAKDIRITGAAPAWLVSALTHAVHPCKVSVYVPQINKDVEIPQLFHGEISKEGEVAFKVTEDKDSVLVEFNMDLPEGITTYDENNLSKVVVPDISKGKAVYISGKGPNYLTVAIAEAYAHTNSSVSLFQPGVGYTCAITHSRAKRLGDLDKDPLGREEIK